MKSSSIHAPAGLDLAGAEKKHQCSNNSNQQQRNDRMTQKLTKRYLYSLPQGVILLSNCFHVVGMPVFSEIVFDQAGRAAQWKRAVAAGASGRNCHVFRDKDELMKSDFARGIVQTANKVIPDILAKLAEIGHKYSASTDTNSAFTVRDIRPPGLPPVSLN